MERIIGHAEAVALLRRGALLDRVSHAYLVTGPRGVGRRTLALELAKTLNCLAEPAARPCNACRQCRLIDRGVHPDVRVVKRASDRKTILLRASGGSPPRDFTDNVEFIQSDAQLRPADGRKKIYVILNAEDLQPEAANRLLKTIEEPTAYVHFVLTATDRGAVLPTIVSRCQELPLRPVRRPDLARALVERGLADPGRAARLAALANGRPGWALASATDAAVFDVHQGDLRHLRDALSADRLSRLVMARGLADRWSAQPDAVRATLRAWLGWWRDLLLTQLGLGDRAVDAGADESGAAAAAGVVRADQARAAQALVQRTLADLESNVNARLALDLLMLRLPRVDARP